MIRLLLLGLALLMGCLFAGCNDASVTVIPVTGTVTYEGRPLENATVALIPAEGQPLPARGITDAAGRFVLHTTLGASEMAGAMPGRYRVAVSKFKMHGLQADGQGLTGAVPRSGARIEYFVPQHYTDADSSGLTCLVENNMAPLLLELKGR